MEIKTAKKLMAMVFAAMLLMLMSAGTVSSTGTVLYDDFEDGVIDPNLWHIDTSGTGSVTEVTGVDGYLRRYAGKPPTMSSHIGEARVVADAIDFKNIDQSTITFDLDWWKNYDVGYIHINLFLTDGNSDVHIKEFNTDWAGDQSGGGLYTLEIVGSKAHLYQDGVSITGDVDISSLDEYKLKFHVYAHSLGGYVPGDLGHNSIIMGFG